MKKIIKQLNIVPALLLLVFATSQSANAATLSLESAAGLSDFTVTQGVEFDVNLWIRGGLPEVSGGSFEVTWTDPNVVFNSFSVHNAISGFDGDSVFGPASIGNDGIQFAGANASGLFTPFIPDPVGDFIFATLKFTASGPLTSALFTLVGDFNNNGWVDASATQINISSTSNATVSTVPVPPAVLLFGSSLLGLIGVNRRRKLA